MNIVYLNPDEMRADVVGCYGHPLAKTPNLDRLAAQGTRYDQCHVQHTVCSPSRCSFMTGWYPHVSGHRTLWHLMRPHEPHLLKDLRRAGYDVYWFGKNDYLAEESFAESVTHYARHGKPLHARCPFPKGDPRSDSFLYGPWQGPVEHHGDAAHALAGVEFLRSRAAGDAPFCLYLPLSYPHCPYTCCEPYYSMYDPDDLPPLRPAETPNKPSYFEAIRRYRRLDECPEELFLKINAVYLGMITFMDRIFGWVLDALDETGLADDTAVLFFSDHGDWAGDFGLVEKWPSGLDDALTRVPLVIRAPGGKAGHVVGEPVELFDIMPTALDLAGIQPQHTHFAQSLIPHIHGAAGDPGRAVFAEGGYDPHEPRSFEGREMNSPHYKAGIYHPKLLQQQQEPQTVTRATMVRTMTHKLVVRPNGTDELYDLQQDPGETRNLADVPVHAETRRALERRMLDWYIRTADVVPFDENPRGLPGRG